MDKHLKTIHTQKHNRYNKIKNESAILQGYKMLRRLMSQMQPFSGCLEWWFWQLVKEAVFLACLFSFLLFCIFSQRAEERTESVLGECDPLKYSWLSLSVDQCRCLWVRAVIVRWHAPLPSPLAADPSCSLLCSWRTTQCSSRSVCSQSLTDRTRAVFQSPL